MITINKIQILELLRLDIQEMAFSSFSFNLTQAQKIFPKNELPQALSELLQKEYRSYNEDNIAAFLRLLINQNQNFVSIKNETNVFFELAITKGSFKLLKCLFEEVYDSYIVMIDEGEKFDFMTNLTFQAIEINEKLAERHQKLYKGIHYSAGILDKESNNIIVHPEDYEIIDDICERYNAIVGRRKIIEYLDRLLPEKNL